VKKARHCSESSDVQNALMKAMWEDSDAKSNKQLEGAVVSSRRKLIQVLNEEFRASLFVCCHMMTKVFSAIVMTKLLEVRVQLCLLFYFGAY